MYQEIIKETLHVKNTHRAVRKTFDWHKEVTLNLIKLWERHPCLYNPKHEMYFSKKARKQALTKIVEGLKPFAAGSITQEDVLNKITILRSQVHHEAAKQRIRERFCFDTGELEPAAFWYPKLRFVRRHIKTKNDKYDAPDIKTESTTASQTGVQDNELLTDNGDTNDINTTDQFPPITKIEVDDYKITPAFVPHIESQSSGQLVDDPDTVSPQNICPIIKIENDFNDEKTLQSGTSIPVPYNTIDPMAQHCMPLKTNISYNEIDTDTFGEYVKTEVSQISDHGLREEVMHQFHSILCQIKSKHRTSS